MYYDWDSSIAAHRKALEKEEKEMRNRIDKAEKLQKSWELLRLCKTFIKENDASWMEGKQKAEMRKQQEEEIQEKEIRHGVAKKKKEKFQEKLLQSRITASVRKLGNVGTEMWKKEERKERIELAEVKENLWSWRENGGGKTRSGKEKVNLPAGKELQKKLEKSNEILDEKQEEAEKWRKRKRL